MSLGTSILLILLDSVAHDFKVACGLGAERGKLSKGSIGVDFSHSQLLQLGCDSVVQFILQVIIRNTCFGSKVQEFREEVMESVSRLHVELSELILRSGHSVRVIVDSLQVFEHISGVFIRVHGFASESGCDVLASFSITSTGHVGTMKLGRVIVVMISLKFLGHQKQPIFKSGFFSISEQWRVRDLSQFARGLSTCSSVIHRVQGVIGNLVGICISVESHLVQVFSCFFQLFLYQDNLTIFGLSIQFRFNQSGFVVIHNIFKSFMYQLELSIKPFRFLVDVSQEVFIGHFMSVWSIILIITINHDGGASVQFSSFSLFRFLSYIGLATRDRNIIQSGYYS